MIEKDIPDRVPDRMKRLYKEEKKAYQNQFGERQMPWNFQMYQNCGLGQGL